MLKEFYIKMESTLLCLLVNQKVIFQILPLNLRVPIITTVAVIGGDGTMHEVLNAVMIDESWLQLSYLLFPCGTGNAFNYDLDCLTNEEAIELLIKGKEHFELI
jgi:diacylglycerol kinase family enzyme